MLMADFTFTGKAMEQYIYWQMQDRKTLKKINSLITDIKRNGAMQGIGKPELLKHNKSGLYSRRIDEASGVLMKYIDEKVSELDAERKTLQEEIVTANVTDTEGRLKQITNHVKTWETLSFEDRQAVDDTLIKVIRIADGNIKIIWNI